jgi:hypothetical protein
MAEEMLVAAHAHPIITRVCVILAIRNNNVRVVLKIINSSVQLKYIFRKVVNAVEFGTEGHAQTKKQGLCLVNF